LPPELIEGANILAWLSANEYLEKLEPLVRINRQGGYCGFDIFITLLLYHSYPRSIGIREFCEKIKPYRAQLASLVNRCKIPTSASISRALQSAEYSLIRSNIVELLINLTNSKELLDWAAIQTWDANGEHYHVFDFDHTSEGVTHRALPVGDDLPQAKQRSDKYAAPGYLGSKRGDAKRTRSSLQHAGTSFWLGGQVGIGNSDPRGDFEAAVKTVQSFCEQINCPLNRAIIRADGAFGYVPNLTACLEAGICMVSRSQQYILFERPEVRQRLYEAEWFEVPSSGSNPKRYAAELGEVILTASEKARRSDNTPYDPIKVRICVSRFRVPDGTTAAQRGKLIDGWQYELYVSIGLSPSAILASDIVSMYYQRTGQENRFAQEDRELELGRLYSDNPAGQEFALLAGQYVWNFRVARGFELAQEEKKLPIQQPRQDNMSSSDEDIKDSWLPKAPDTENQKQKDKSSISNKDMVNELLKCDQKINQILCKMDWQSTLANRDGWHWDGKKLICPSGFVMRIQGTSYEKGVPTLRFVSPPTSCSKCKPRINRICSKSKAPTKLVHIKTTPQIVKALHPVIQHRCTLRASIKVNNHKSEKKMRKKDGKRSISTKFFAAQNQINCGSYALYWPLFLPANARKIWIKEVAKTEIKVEVIIPKQQPPKFKIIAKDDGDRQHRRLTWKQRFDWNKLPDDARVSIEIITQSGKISPWFPKTFISAAA